MGHKIFSSRTAGCAHQLQLDKVDKFTNILVLYSIFANPKSLFFRDALLVTYKLFDWFGDT